MTASHQTNVQSLAVHKIKQDFPYILSIVSAGLNVPYYVLKY
jgi:hypothetical protein